MYDKLLTTKWFYLRRLERSLSLRFFLTIKSLNEVIIGIFFDYLQRKFFKVWNPNIFPGWKSVPYTMTLFYTSQHNNNYPASINWLPKVYLNFKAPVTNKDCTNALLKLLYLHYLYFKTFKEIEKQIFLD